MQFSTDFIQNYTKNSSTISVAVATVDVPLDWFGLKMKAYWYLVKVTKFELSTELYEYDRKLNSFYPQ